MSKRDCGLCDSGKCKYRNPSTGALECYRIEGCLDCEEQTIRCRQCDEGLRVMLPEAKTCGICDRNTHFKIELNGHDNYCVERPFIPIITNVTYDKSKEL